ncbi:MAG: M20/M25/M40 family metallo-hydrolase [Gemmatimonadota bacterium]
MTEPTIERAFLLDALTRYVATNSVNPAFSNGSTDESALAAVVARDLEEAGLEVRTVSAAPGRDSVVGTLTGRGGGRSLMLYAHLDTVSPGEMAAPFEPTVRDGKLFGRGAYDMKAGLASCVAVARAAASLDRRLAGDVVVVGAADEEAASIGMQAVLEEVRVDGAIVTEPTELDLCLAHKGFAWYRVTTHGRAAHGSRFDQGVDANLRMGRFLGRLEALERSLRAHPEPHPHVGPPSLHAATIRGGAGPSIYADRCELQIERRLMPGETADAALDELAALLRALETEDDSFHADIELLLARDSFECRPDSELALVLASAWKRVTGSRPGRSGRPSWMDAALLAAAGVDTVVFGAAGAGAHADVEWVDLASVERHAEVLLDATLAYTGSSV